MHRQFIHNNHKRTRNRIKFIKLKALKLYQPKFKKVQSYSVGDWSMPGLTDFSAVFTTCSDKLRRKKSLWERPCVIITNLMGVDTLRVSITVQ
jgi:hypothetical protein